MELFTSILVNPTRKEVDKVSNTEANEKLPRHIELGDQPPIDDDHNQHDGCKDQHDGQKKPFHKNTSSQKIDKFIIP